MPRQTHHDGIELRVRKRIVDPAVALGGQGVEVACAQRNPEGAGASDQRGKATGWQPGDPPGSARVAQLRYTVPMKTATIPSVRVEPEFRAEVEAVLTENETLSEFVEAAVRAGVARRRVQAEFIARGLRSRDEARRTGEYVDADVVLGQLQRKLDTARARAAKTRR